MRLFQDFSKRADFLVIQSVLDKVDWNSQKATSYSEQHNVITYNNVTIA